MEKKQTVCVDLDGVLAKYTWWHTSDNEWQEIGEPIEGAAEFLLQELRNMGFRIMIYTTRCNPTVNKHYPLEELILRVKTWLDKHGMIYDGIYSGTGKPMAAYYIDDNGVRCDPQKDGKQTFIHVIAFIKQRQRGKNG